MIEAESKRQYCLEYPWLHLQSAARSKVRKLRYIAELDSKSAALQQQMTEMTAELRNLQENTARIGV
jgi:hypothetical protein